MACHHWITSASPLRGRQMVSWLLACLLPLMRSSSGPDARAGDALAERLKTDVRHPNYIACWSPLLQLARQPCQPWGTGHEERIHGMSWQQGRHCVDFVSQTMEPRVSVATSARSGCAGCRSRRQRSCAPALTVGANVSEARNRLAGC